MLSNAGYVCDLNYKYHIVFSSDIRYKQRTSTIKKHIVIKLKKLLHMYVICHTIIIEVIPMLSIRLNTQAEKELKEIAKFEGMSVSEYVRNIINEKLEDMYDIKLADEAYAKHMKDPVSYSHDEVKDKLGID